MTRLLVGFALPGLLVPLLATAGWSAGSASGPEREDRVRSFAAAVHGRTFAPFGARPRLPPVTGSPEAGAPVVRLRAPVPMEAGTCPI